MSFAERGSRFEACHLLGAHFFTAFVSWLLLFHGSWASCGCTASHRNHLIISPSGRGAIVQWLEPGAPAQADRENVFASFYFIHPARVETSSEVYSAALLSPEVKSCVAVSEIIAVCNDSLCNIGKTTAYA